MYVTYMYMWISKVCMYIGTIEPYKLFNIGQALHLSGNDALELILVDMACIPHQGEINLKDIHINLSVPIDDDKLHVMNVSLVTDITHAISIIVDNRDRTYTILDSSGHDSRIHVPIIDRVFTNRGYTSKPHTCPRNLLPQQDDPLCTAWSIYMIYMACKGINITDIPSLAKKNGLISFISHAWELLQGTDVLHNYRRWRRIYSNYIINGLSNLLPKIRGYIYKRQSNKSEFLDSIDLDFDIKTAIDREGSTYEFFNNAAMLLHKNNIAINELIGAESMQDMIDIINMHYKKYHARYLVYLIFTRLLIKGGNVASYIRSRLTMEEANIINDHYVKYRNKLHEMASNLGINGNEYQLLLDTKKKGIKYSILFPDME